MYATPSITRGGAPSGGLARLAVHVDNDAMPSRRTTPSPDADKRQILARVPLLRAIEPADLAHLAAFARFERFAAGQVIFHRGDPGYSMMVAVDGHVRISTTSIDGRMSTLNIVNPGDVFGEIALLDGGQRTADATALEPALLLVLSRRDILPFLETHPRVAMRLVEVMCGRLRQTDKLIEDTRFLDFAARLARQLIWLGKAYGRPTPEGTTIGLKLSQREIGSLAGASRESTNKLLHAWQQQGLISIGSGFITIRAPERLRQLGEEEGAA
jgi:CRP/FNR family transcriptional regulator, cyclic AMP receptor protein